MSESLNDQWKHFADMRSGRRFQNRNRARRARKSGLARKLLIMGLGFVLVLAGIAMLALPGPGILTILIGAALIAEESMVAARWLDRADLWITRRVLAWRQRRAARKSGLG